ncbi:hypothetical protein FFF34_009955 [Inquilinus sp. KBS0705]|nr:hypothetical protein FFF34_009955 [Inquilinus sp. KBS0705]
MKIKLSWRYCLAFMAFVFVFGQLHELTHLSAARVVCGDPGRQVDFNLWTLSENCTISSYAYVPTIFGPVFSYVMMWTGFFMLLSNNKQLWPAAFVLILGNLAFARIFTAGMGGGDETTVLKVLLSGQPVWLIRLTGFALVFALASPSLFMVYKRLNNKHKLWLLAGFCVLPLLIMMPYEFMLLGKLIKTGFMARPGILGVVDFIYLHTSVMAVVVLLFTKTLFQANAKSLT